MLESVVTYDKKLWAEAVLTSVYIKNRQPHSALKDLTPYEAFHGSKPSIQHLQPFGRECYIDVLYQKRKDGKKLSPRAQRAIFTGYTKTINHYRVFLPDTKKTIVSADIFFPPLQIEGASPQQTKSIHQQQTPSTQMTLDYTYTNGGEGRDDLWRQWMRENPQEADNMFDNGHPTVDQIILADFKAGKRDEYLGAPYWVYDDNDMAYRETLPEQPVEDDIQSFDGSEYIAIPNDHFLEEEEHQNPDQQSQLPMGHVGLPPSQPMTPPPIPFGQVVTRGGRVVKPPDRYGFGNDATMLDVPSRPPTPDNQPLEGLEESQWANLSVLLIEQPKSYRQAKVSPQWSDWKKAMDDELKSLKENDVWDVIPKPVGRKIVASRWVFKAKGNAQGEVERYKARLIAKGFSQILGQDYDEIFASVVRYDSLRLVLAISACKGWRPRQLDVKTAFLYGILKEEVYMDLLEGSRLYEMVAKLKRCKYGLKQSPREWYYRLVEYLGPFGFVITAWDPCVLVHESGNLFLAIYVDDITLFGATGELKEQTINVLKTEFKVNDMGELNWLLGIQLTFTDNGISLFQTTFIDKILNRFSMQDCKPVSTPIDPNHRLKAIEVDEQRTDTTAYQQIIGSLMYLVTGTRPDLAYPITHLSQFNSSPSITHLTAAKGVLRYLQGTKDRHRFYPWNNELKMTAYTDASYGNCLDTRRSFSGYIFRLGNATISWRCRKQRSVATSTCEAEYMALAMTTKHHLGLKRGSQELLKIDIPTALFFDSNAAIDVAYNPKLNDRSQHIDVAYHFTREQIDIGNVSVMYVPSEDNMADICTKGMTRYVNDHLCSKIFGSK